MVIVLRRRSAVGAHLVAVVIVEMTWIHSSPPVWPSAARRSQLGTSERLARRVTRWLVGLGFE